MTFSNGQKWIPENFEPSKTVLLVEKLDVSERQTKKMEDYMSEKYPYKYEFVSLSTIKTTTGKYADTKLYKYALVISSHLTTYTHTDGSASAMRTTGYDFNFYDRSNDKEYPSTTKSSGYPIMTFEPVINTIVKKFE